MGHLLRAPVYRYGSCGSVSRWRTCFCRHLGGINIKEKKGWFLILRGDGISERVRRKEETNASTEVLERCSSLGESISWGVVGVSLARSRKFIVADRRHEAKKRN